MEGIRAYELNHFYIFGLIMILVPGDVFSLLHGFGIHSIFANKRLQFSY